ncbi:MAG: sigma-70 family RNA polymerase sigma factor [Chitinophagaceae bacterium]|nr:sigma-70 family RNA polymerase sigma factor [Chitinophagaceae bacterium]
MPDGELVASYKSSGKLDVLSILYQRYMDLVFGVCLKYLKNNEAAKDAVMQLFEELVHKLRQHDVENFKSWLYTMAKNHCLMQLRTPRNLKTVEFNADSMHSQEPVHLNDILESEHAFKSLDGCMESLSGDQRRTVELFYLKSKCYNEIAEITGLEWNKVRSLIQNGRRNLKICMEKQIISSE